MSEKMISYTFPIAGQTLSIREALANVPEQLSESTKQALKERIKKLLKRENAALVAHYYVDPELQALADETGGCVADSLEMARFGRDNPATTLIVAGVQFMGETAKILSPNKRILMPDLHATCSLDLGCPAEEFIKFCDQHTDRTVVVYANTSAKVKARADWVVTSAIALDIVKALHEQGEKILWAPDQHLGNYIQEQTGADMLLWQGNCIVHDEFKGIELEQMRQQYPDAKILVHPESPQAVVEQADVVGSTTQLIKAAQQLPDKRFIVATDRGVLYKMKLAAPNKEFFTAPTAGNSATCKSCAMCPWMAMNTLQNLADALEQGTNEIHVEQTIAEQAQLGINRMLDFSTNKQINVKASGDLAKDQPLFSNVGAV